MIDFEKPRFFDNKLADLFNEKMLGLTNKRLDKRISYNEEKVSRIIKELEEANARVQTLSNN